MVGGRMVLRHDGTRSDDAKVAWLGDPKTRNDPVDPLKWAELAPTIRSGETILFEVPFACG